MGGFDGEKMVSSVEIFDPRNDSWMEGEPLNHVRGNASAAVLGDSLFVIGGVDGQNDIVDKVLFRVSSFSSWLYYMHLGVLKTHYVYYVFLGR